MLAHAAKPKTVGFIESEKNNDQYDFALFALRRFDLLLPNIRAALSSVAIYPELKTAEFRVFIAVKKIFESDNPTIS